jgi:hypothetical protein
VDLGPDRPVHRLFIVGAAEPALSDDGGTYLVNGRTCKVSDSDIPVRIEQDVLAADVDVPHVVLVEILRRVGQVTRPPDALLNRRGTAVPKV